MTRYRIVKRHQKYRIEYQGFILRLFNAWWTCMLPHPEVSIPMTFKSLEEAQATINRWTDSTPWKVVG